MSPSVRRTGDVDVTEAHMRKPLLLSALTNSCVGALSGLSTTTASSTTSTTAVASSTTTTGAGASTTTTAR
jgi:hypothetical protein